MTVKVLIHASMIHSFVSQELMVQKDLHESRGWLLVEAPLGNVPMDIRQRTELYYGKETKDKLNLLEAREYFDKLPTYTLQELGERMRQAYIVVHGAGEWESVGKRWANVFNTTACDDTLKFYQFAAMSDALKHIVMESIGSASYLKVGETFLTEDGRYATIRATDLNVAGEGYDILASVRDADGVDFIEWYKRTDAINGVLNNDSGTSGLSIVLCTAGVKPHTCQ